MWYLYGNEARIEGVNDVMVNLSYSLSLIKHV